MAEINLSKRHISYLLNDFGLNGFLQKFRSGDALNFIRWLGDSVDGEEDDSGLVVINVPNQYLKIAGYGASIIAYKITADSLGSIIPSKLIKQINDLGVSGGDTTVKETKLPSSANVDVWDGYDVLSLWVADVHKCIADRFDLIAEILEKSDIAPSGEGGFHPVFKIVSDSAQVSTGDTSVINIEPLISQYGDDILLFKNPTGATVGKGYPDFSTTGWRTVLFAIISVELANSYVAHCRKLSIINADVKTKTMMDVKYGDGWREAYYLLRDQLVEPRLIE
ncbi:hypothetical protein [Photobacterium kishitanii]|uniref:Uncharacterized protein n=1 Tax=Photobacterium kishitanii TaxID=318456 RepID=A0A2T3KM95_9GAMM|nr:hypothetical protein [Photobacterium kishitanii]PSV00908.1 hypothetical protein C9J27_02455 [Photobacterium kishitanii]